MDKKPPKREAKKPRPPRRGKPVSIDSAILFFGPAAAIHDRAVLEQALKLALRSPDLLGEKLRELLESQGADVDAVLGPDASKPPSKAEVLALAEPLLKRGADWASWAQIADIYFFNTDRSPENLVYAFYNGTRYVIAGDKRPTGEQVKRIWHYALLLARTSKMGAPHWKKLKEESPTALEDWLVPIKETARKRYKTFLSQKRRADLTAEECLKNLMAEFFGGPEDA